MKTKFVLPLLTFVALLSCNKNDATSDYIPIEENYPNVKATFGVKIDLNSLQNYSNQSIPAYINKDNTIGNPITDKGATLGRVLFYDKKLSANNTVSCSSCHIQAAGFGDVATASVGINGLTPRHSMRLINSRFANERKFFWDERVWSLEIQTSQPIQNHVEMGYSGLEGDETITNLMSKLSQIPYYPELFKFVYGSEEITENKIQLALAQFVRSIQSFDSKFDVGRSLVMNQNDPFPNFSPLENQGKNIFSMPPQFDATGNRIGGGVGCAGCHAAPEFDIDPNTKNNGVIGIMNATGFDYSITRAPSLRDLIRPNGNPNGPMMHNGSLTTLQEVLSHYNTINADSNPNLDQRLRPNGFGQKLHITMQESDAIIAFLKTLSGVNVYVDPKWSSPF
jgi:cytochrome c peroxidase